MIKKIILLLLLLAPQVLHSELNINSLRSELNSAGKNERPAILFDISLYYYIHDRKDSALQATWQAYSISKELQQTNGEIDALNNIAFIYNYYNEDSSLVYAKKTLALSQSSHYKRGEAEAMLYIAWYYLRKQNSVYAVEYFQKANALSNSINANDLRAYCMANIGEAYILKNDYKSALDYYFKSLNLFEKSLSSKPTVILKYNYGLVLNSLGITYKTLEKYQESSHYYAKYLEISQQLGDTWSIGIAYNNMGIVFYRMGQYDKALEYYDLAEQIFNQLSDKETMAKLMMNTCNVYTEMKNFRMAEDCLAMSKSLFSEIGSRSGLIKIEATLGNIFLQKKQFSKAKSQFLKALSMMKSEEDVEMRISILESLYHVSDTLGNYKAAIDYFKQYTSLKNSLFNNTKAQEIGQIEEQYKLLRQLDAEKRQQLEQAKINESRLNRRNNLQYFGISLFIIFVFGVIFLTGRFKLSKRKIEMLVFAAFIMLFEFIQILIEPVKNLYAGGIPIVMLALNIIIAMLIFPLHSFFEESIKKRVLKRDFKK